MTQYTQEEFRRLSAEAELNAQPQPIVIAVGTARLLVAAIEMSLRHPLLVRDRALRLDITRFLRRLSAGAVPVCGASLRGAYPVWREAELVADLREFEAATRVCDLYHAVRAVQLAVQHPAFPAASRPVVVGIAQQFEHSLDEHLPGLFALCEAGWKVEDRERHAAD